MRDIMRQIREQNDGGKVKKRRAKATTRAPEDQDPIDNQAPQAPAGKGFSERPTKEELLEWAATQRRLHKDGQLPDPFVKALEAVPGWTWDTD